MKGLFIEKWDANPAANTFEYVVENLMAEMRCKYLSVIAQGNITEGYYCIYKKSVVSWSQDNYQYAIYAGQFNAATAPRYCVNEQLDIVLPPGIYTFAAYLVTDIAKFKMCWHLEYV